MGSIREKSNNAIAILELIQYDPFSHWSSLAYILSAICTNNQSSDLPFFSKLSGITHIQIVINHPNKI